MIIKFSLIIYKQIMDMVKCFKSEFFLTNIAVALVILQMQSPLIPPG